MHMCVFDYVMVMFLIYGVRFDFVHLYSVVNNYY